MNSTSRGATRHILFATDLSVASSRARHHALALAERVGAKLTILHVVEPADFPRIAAQVEAQLVDAKREVEWLALDARPRIPDVTGIARIGVPATEIPAVAVELDADLIVVGTHGRSGVSHILLGSVAEKVVRRSAMPVLTVPSWIFSDLRHAAHALARRVTVARNTILVGVGRSGALLAAHLSSLTGASADALLVAPLVVDGAVMGFVGEEGTTVLHAPASRIPEHVSRNARDTVAAEAEVLRGPCPRLEVCDHPVVIVSACADDALLLKLALDAQKQTGASHVTGAFAVASPAVLGRACDAFDDVVTLHSVASTAERAIAYHEEPTPTIGAVRKYLARARQAQPSQAATASSRSRPSSGSWW